MMHSLKNSSRIGSSKRLWQEGSVFRKELYSISTTTCRFQSDSKAASAATICPFTGSPSTVIDSSYPELKHVPAYPYIGSVVAAFSGIPNTMVTDAHSFWPEMRDKYGDFYTIGIPGTGSRKDSKGTMHVISDPREMAKVVRAGGSYPSGMAQGLWINHKWSNSRGMKTGALFQQGKEWKRIRNFMQTDLMHPDAAKSYIPGMIEAARIASRAAPTCKDNLNTYFNHCAFDLFAAIMFGEFTKAADPNAKSNPENIVFAKSVVDGLSNAISILMDPFEGIAGNVFGLTTKKQQYTFDKFDKALEIGRRKVSDFTERKERGELDENEQNSYLFKAIDRQKKDDSITLEEAQELAFIGLFAAVDTTSAILGWNVFNVARSPKVQGRLYEELSDAIATVGNGQLTADVFSKKHSPYLHAVIRETQRLTPPSALFTLKTVDNELEINGVPMQKGDVVALEGFSIGMDPAYVDNPEEFIPERWLPDAVAARKGTERQIIDHAFLKEPFSQGARRCPGSRVAANETQVLLSQLVLDWNMTTEAKTLDDINYSQKTLLELDVPVINFEPREAVELALYTA